MHENGPFEGRFGWASVHLRLVVPSLRLELVADLVVDCLDVEFLVGVLQGVGAWVRLELLADLATDGLDDEFLEGMFEGEGAWVFFCSGFRRFETSD